MTQFFKKFLNEEGSRLSPDTGRFLALGAFGKPPGWDDHIEDLGLETETLTLAKRVLYVQGVGGQIDTGAWEKLGPAQRLEGFNHVIMWRRSGQLLLGRMWSSSDGKGRTRYPMVVCAHCCNLSLAWAVQYVLPRIVAIEAACKATTAAQDVRSILDRERASLRAALGSPGAGDMDIPGGTEALTRFVSDPAFGPDQQGWFRILYQVQNQLAAYAPGNFNGKADVASLRPQQIRVPAAAPSADQAILLWSRFLASRIDQLVPAFFALSVNNTWLDVILGEPGSQEFFCLRATPAVLPLATDVPYTIEDEFKVRATKMLAEFSDGKRPSGGGKPAGEKPSPGGWASFTQRWFGGKGPKVFLALGAVGILVAASAAALLYHFSSRQLAGNQAVPVAVPAAKAGAGVSPGDTPQPPPIEPAKTAAATAPPPSAAMPTVQPSSPAQGSPANQQTGKPSPPPGPGEVAPLQPVEPGKAVAVTAPQPAPPPKPEPVAPVAPPPVSNQRIITASIPVGTGAVAQVQAAAPALPPNAATGPVRQSSMAVPAAPSSALRTTFTNAIGMVLVWIAALPGTADGAWVGKYEVTQKEFEQVAGSNPSRSKNPLQPVESLTWQEAVDFCRKLTAIEKAGGTLPAGFSYSLPTPAQWDFFLADARFEDGVTSRALKDALGSPSTVGTLGANRFGLHDVLGNVWEWCADPGASGEHMLKGSAYDSRKNLGFGPLDRTTAWRLASSRSSTNAGFRCILAPQP